jgi:pilus assembly protein Flp/PilA
MTVLNKLQDGVTKVKISLSKAFHLKSQKGVTMIEYALIASLVAVASVTVTRTVGTKVTNVFTTVSSKLP